MQTGGELKTKNVQSQRTVSPSTQFLDIIEKKTENIHSSFIWKSRIFCPIKMSSKLMQIWNDVLGNESSDFLI